MNTDNNLSELTMFEAVDFRGGCVPDSLEENDTIATAAPILLETEYFINDCYEQLDVFSIELQEGNTYELMTFDSPENISGSEVARWPHTIIDSANRYLYRPTTATPRLFQPLTTGIHYFVLRHIVHDAGSGVEFGFTINSVP